MAVMIALLRGINVGGNKKVPMAELTSLAQKLGAKHVETYIQSGNVVFSSSKAPDVFELALEKAIAAHFGFAVAVIVRNEARWQAYAKGSAFPDAEAARPNLLHLALSKEKPKAGAAGALLALGNAGERVAAHADGLWIDFAGGVGRSKLTPAAIDRAVGSSVTMRNWNTVRALAEVAARIHTSSS